MDKNRLKGAIVGAGLSQRELARRINLSKNTLNAKINGKSFFDTEQIDQICKELKIYDNKEKALIFLSQSSQNRDEL